MQNRAIIETIRGQYQRGKITLEEARVLVQPIIDEMNTKGSKIAKKYGRKFNKLTFGYIFR